MMHGLRSGNEGECVEFASDAAAQGDGEHPAVVLRDICSKPRPNGHIIVFANEKGGVGKSTLAFHCAVALCDAGKAVTVVDLDQRQRTLAKAFASREGTARSLNIILPSPKHILLRNHSSAQLCQEIARVGSDGSYIVIDLASHDSAMARRAIAYADTLVTPINSSFVDIDLLGRFDPVTMHLKEPGHFASLVMELREERARLGLPMTDWIVAKNRIRQSEKRQQVRIDKALQQLAPSLGFRIGDGFAERVAYRELLPFGLTHLDLKHIPHLARVQQPTGDEIVRLIADLDLPGGRDADKPLKQTGRAKLMRKTSDAFRAALDAHMQPVIAEMERAS